MRGGNKSEEAIHLQTGAEREGESSGAAIAIRVPATRAYWIPNLMHAKLAIGEAKKFATRAQRKKIAAAVTRDFPSLKDRAKKLAK